MGLKDKLETLANAGSGGIASLVRGSIRYKAIVYLILSLLIVSGVFGLVNMNKDEFPTFEIKLGLVAAVYPGADVHQVEAEVGKPLEQLLFSFSEVDRHSTKVVSKDGICYVYVDLTTPASKKDEVWSKIKLKINTFKQTLPPGVLAVVVLDDFSAVTSVLIAIESQDKGWSEMKGYAEDLTERLRMIPQLSNVQMLGVQEEEIAVKVDMDRLSAYGISPSSLLLDYQTASLQTPSGTFVTDYTVSPIHIPKTVSDERELYDKIIFSTPDGEVLRLRDIATVERRYKTPSSMVSYNGHTAIVLSVEMRPDNNIVAFGNEVDKVIDEFLAEAPDSIKLSRITDQPKVVGSSVWSFLRDLLISMLVVIAVMLLLFPMRSALIASSGVPVCTAVALALMYVFGICLNTVSLAALIVVLGMIVDDSVITMDGYMDKLSHGMSRMDAACASAKELFTPMFMATFAISAMFFPMTKIITGYLGDFVATFPWVIAFSLMTSLVYAVTIVPSLEVKYIKGAAFQKENFITRIQNRLFKALQAAYDWMQDRCFNHPYLTILGGIAAVGLGLLMFSKTNLQLMPMAARPVFAIEMYLDPSADIQDTRKIADSLSVLLRQDSRVTSVTEFIGSGTPRFHATYSPILPGRNVAQLIVNTRSAKATESFLAENEDKFEHYFPEAIIHFKQMDYQGTSTPVEVFVSGENYDDLRNVALQLKDFMNGVESIKWVHSDADWYTPSISLEMDADEASRIGVNRSLMNLSLAGALNGLPISSIREGSEVIPVNLYASNFDGSIDYKSLGNTLVPTLVPGLSVPLRQVADIVPEWNPETLCRLNGKPCISVSADMRFGNSQPVAMREIRNFVENELVIPDGVTLEYGGLNGVNGYMGPEIALSFLAAIAVLFFFLVFHFKKISLAVLTMVLSTLCLFGAFFGLWIFDLDFSMTAVLGLVSLVGIIVRNGIIMFEYAEELRIERGYSAKDAAEEAGKRRMRPIFLTSATTALGVLPMVISADLLWMPMGVVICFGTILSMVLITLIMPVSYWLIFKHSESKSRNVTSGGAVVLLVVAMMTMHTEQLGAQGLNLSLDDCKTMAMQKSAASLNAALDLKAARLQKQEALAEYFPRVSASLFGYFSLNPLIDIGVRDILGSNDFTNNLQNTVESYGSLYGINTAYRTMKQGYAASVTALQPVYAGGRIVAGNALAKLGVEAADLQQSIQQRKTKAEVEDIWWQISSLEEKRETLESLGKILDNLTVSLNEAVEAGLAAETDILQLQLRQSELNAGRKQLASGLKLLKINLLNLIGQPFALYGEIASDERPFIDEILLDINGTEQVLSPQDYWRDEAEILGGMEECRLLDLQVKAGQLEKRMVLGEAMPQLLVGVVSAYSNLMDKGKFNTIALATLQLPLSDWGKTARKAQRIETKVEKARNDRDYLSRQLSLQISKLWMDLQTSYDLWQVATESAEIATRLFNVAQTNYNAGLIPLQDLLQAESKMRESISAAADRLIDYRTAIRAYNEL